MNHTTFAVRLAKLLAVTGVGLLTFLVTFNNLTDYFSSYYFVEHVMKMDTTFSGNKLMYRSVNTVNIYHLAYMLIMVLEAVTSYCCLKGSWNMYRNINKKALHFQSAKLWAIYGLTMGVVIWFIIFEVIAGEWFVMWQSSKWNGLYSADRIVTFIGISLIMLMLKEDELEVYTGGDIKIKRKEGYLKILSDCIRTTILFLSIQLLFKALPREFLNE